MKITKTPDKGEGAGSMSSEAATGGGIVIAVGDLDGNDETAKIKSFSEQFFLQK